MKNLKDSKKRLIEKDEKDGEIMDLKNIKTELFNDNSRIISGTASRKHSLLLLISHTMWVQISMVAIQCGIKVGTIKTEKANLREKRLLIQILISTCMSISIFVASC